MNDLPPSGIPPIPEAAPYAPPMGTIVPPPTPADALGELAVTESEKTMGMVGHLAAFGGLLFPFPFVNVVGPLVVWVTQKDKSAYIAHHAKEALNFQITVGIAVCIAFVTLFLLIGFVLLPAVGIYAMVMTIIAAIKAKEGVAYRYPYTLRFIK